MINLSKRLQTIADLVDKNSKIIDVGCDHALLDIYLVKNKIVKKAIASDITPGALNQAKKNIEYYELTNEIDARLGDGLETLTNTDKINTVIISGMGDQKILSILNNYDLSNINTLIIQSNIKIPVIRKKITKLGYAINNEKLVKENNIIYTVIKFKKGNNKYNNKEYLFGPVLLKNKTKLFKENINNKINKSINIINNLPNKDFIKKIKLKIYIKKLKKEI